MSEVDYAKREDADEILSLLRIRQQEDGGDPLDEAKVVQAIEDGIAKKWAIIGVIRGPQRVEASVGLWLEPQWFSSVRRVMSRWDFVHPECRRSSHAKKLVIFAKSAATRLQCSLVMELPENERTARKKEMVARHMPFGASTFIFAAPDCEVPRAEVG